jgi:hypothetical protein
MKLLEPVLFFNPKIFLFIWLLIILEMNHAVMTEIDLEKKENKQLHKNKELLR